MENQENQNQQQQQHPPQQPPQQQQLAAANPPGPQPHPEAYVAELLQRMEHLEEEVQRVTRCQAEYIRQLVGRINSLERANEHLSGRVHSLERANELIVNEFQEIWDYLRLPDNVDVLLDNEEAAVVPDLPDSTEPEL